MQAILKRFSQEVDLENTNAVKYFLVFDINGKEERLPVEKETVETLTNVIYGSGGQVKVAEVDEEDDLNDFDKLREMGPVSVTSVPEGAESYEAPEEEEFDEEEEPLTEDEVPSL